MRLLRLVVLCIFGSRAAEASSSHSFACERESSLRPDESRHDESVESGGCVEYLLKDLNPDTDYEVRISYPATAPADFSFELVSRKEGSTWNRRILNTEKALLRAQSQGDGGVIKVTLADEVAAGAHAIRVHALATGVSFIPRAAPPLRYRIVLETIVFGVPRSAWQLIGFAAIVFAIFTLAVVQQQQRQVAVGNVKKRVHRRRGGRWWWLTASLAVITPSMLHAAPSATVPLPSTLRISTITWNLAGRSPLLSDCTFLRAHRGSHLVAVGVQECVRSSLTNSHNDLQSRRWHRITSFMLGSQFRPIVVQAMGGIQMAIFARKNLLAHITTPRRAQVPCGVGNVLYNKGAVATRFSIGSRSLMFVNAHLAAHRSCVPERIADCERISQQLTPTTSLALERPSPLSGAADLVVFFGDLNFRVDLPRKEVERLVMESRGVRSPELKHKYLHALRADQLTRALESRQVLPGFTEGEIRFPPTYKYERGSSRTFELSNKRRTPSWTDRVLFSDCAAPGRRLPVNVAKYDSVVGGSHSDHHAVFAVLDVGLAAACKGHKNTDQG